MSENRFITVTELSQDNWRASTDKGYFHGKTEAMVRAKYAASHIKVGDRVRAVDFGPAVVDDNENVPPGTLGTVSFIDDNLTLHVTWDNGARLGLIVGHDKWERA